MSSDARERGLLVVISGPSGVGKTTVCDRLKALPGFVASISATTRRSRPGEHDGVHYQFMNREAFDLAVREGLFLEHAAYDGKSYGTPRGPVEEKLGEGKLVVLNIEVEGHAQVRKSGLPMLSFFLEPPSMEVLRLRLERRGDRPAEIERRTRVAEREMARATEYDYRIVNDEVERTAGEIVAIIDGRRRKES